MLVPTETEGTEDIIIDSNVSSKKDSNGHVHSESDAAILRALNSLQDHVFSERFMLPPQKVGQSASRKHYSYCKY